MKTAEEIISLLAAQEKALAERIKILETQEQSLQQNPQSNKELLANVQQEIIKTVEEKIEISASRKEIEKSQKFDYDKLRESISDFNTMMGMGMHMAQAVINPAAMEEVKDIQSYINPPVQEHVIADHLAECKAEIVTNLSSNSKTFQEVNEIKIKQVKEEFEKIDDQIKDAAENNIHLPESKDNAGRKWKEDIIQKENDLIEKHTVQLKAIERNKAGLEIQIEDARKFPDSEKKLKLLEPLKENIENEIKNTNNQFNKKLDEIKIEKLAFKNAIDSTQNMGADLQEKKIEKQREDFKIQKEQERLKEIQGRSGIGI